MAITEEHIRRFDDDGFLIVENLLNSEQVEKARAAEMRIFRGEYRHDRRPPEYRRQLRTYPEDSRQSRHLVNGRFLDQDLWDISVSPHIAEIAAQLLRTSSLSLMEDQMIGKAPRSGPTAYHQDAPYLTFLRSWDVINCWIALTDLTPDSSPLLCIRGSHRWPVTAKPTQFMDGPEENMDEVVREMREQGEPVDEVAVVVPAGSGVFFGALAMHGSAANRSDRFRYAYTLHYAGAEARANTARWSSSYLPFVVEGIEDGGRIVSSFMPIVYEKTV